MVPNLPKLQMVIHVVGLGTAVHPGQACGRLRFAVEVPLVSRVPVHLPQQVQEGSHQVQAAVRRQRAAGFSGLCFYESSCMFLYCVCPSF